MFQKEMYSYMKYLCSYAEKHSLFDLFFFFFGVLLEVSMEKNLEEQTPVCCCENPVTLGIKCFLEESLTSPV